METYAITKVGASGVNADNYYISTNNDVFAVADGASGAYDKVGSSLWCMEAIGDLDFNDTDLNPQDYIRDRIFEANERLIKKSREYDALCFGTLTMCVYDKGTLYTGMIGDTPALLIREGQAKRLCKPRKRYARAIEFGQLTEEEAEEAISKLPRYMQSGFEVFLPSVLPDIAKSQANIRKGDILLICCDGVVDWIKDDELAQFFSSSQPVNEICEKVFSKVEERCLNEWLDDRTIVVAKF